MPAPLKIGLFAPYDLSADGGVGTQVRAQARALRERGHAVTVYGPASAPLGDGEIALGGSRRVTFGGTASGLGLNPLAAWRVARVFESSQFDIVHVHEPLTPIVPWLVLRRARAPIVGTFHVHREGGHRLYAMGRPLLRPLMRRIAYRIAVSEAARRTVAGQFPGRYDIVPNGIDIERFTVRHPPPTVFRAGERHVLYVGRLEPRKGTEFLIRAMRRVQERVPSTRLVIVGEGPDRQRLESLAAAIGVDATFLGRVHDADLPAYFQATDIVCAPAIGGESFGLVLLEAMASGTAVVASRIDGYEAVAGDGCAALVAPGHVDALADALAGLLEDDTRRGAMGARALARAHLFDWRAIAGRLEAIYYNLLQAR
jgi:phosphatidyl-myo-inositol alpha-mannosyltransferase